MKINNKFVRYLLTNALIVIGLIPISILFTKLMGAFDSDIGWFIIGTISLLIVSYMMYKNEERGKQNA